MNNELYKLIELCSAYEQIYIYGAGRNASVIFEFLKSQTITVSGFIVSSLQNNPETLFNLPVVSVTEFQSDEQRLILVSIAKDGKYYKDVFDCLVSNRIHNVFFMTADLMTEIKKEPLPFQMQDIFHGGAYYLSENVSVEKYHRILAMAGSDGEEYRWRFRDSMVYGQNIRDISDVFPHKSALQEYEELYGKYLLLQSITPTEEKKRMNCNIYMAQSHADKGRGPDEKMPEWVIPLQVGAALADKRICGLMDNMGDNISEKNVIFSECTGLYWMWKNAPKTDYIGLCHYRRHFAVSEEELTNLMNAGVDVLVTTPTFVNETVERFLLTFVPQSDFQILLETIEHVCPEYLPTAQRFLKARFYPPCNLSVMKWDLFQKYAEYVFSVAFEIECFYNELGFMRKDRYMGYLVECLMGIFLMHNKERLKIAYTDMEYYE